MNWDNIKVGKLLYILHITDLYYSEGKHNQPLKPQTNKRIENNLACEFPASAHGSHTTQLQAQCLKEVTMFH